MENDSVPHGRWLRIIPIALLMYTISFINRTNISLALPAISRDLHMNPGEAGEVAGIFFWGYLLLQVPGGYIAERWSAKWLVSIMLGAWGLCAIGCGLAENWHQLALMRLLLGVAEGSVYPATLVLISNWFPREERARANGFWNLCLPVAVVVSSPLSGWILDEWNWRVMLIASGIVPFIWLFFWVIFIDDNPRTAKWINAAERQYLEYTLARERVVASSTNRGDGPRWPLLQPSIFVMIVIYFCFIYGSIGMVFWLPTVLELAVPGHHFLVSVLYTVPFVVGAVAMVANAMHSDKVRERRVHISLPLIAGGFFLLAAVVSSKFSPIAAYLCLCLSGVGLFGILGPFWAILSEMLPTKSLGMAIGLINAVGSLGGYFGPLAVGYLDKLTGGFEAPLSMLALTLLIGGAMPFLLSRGQRPETPDGLIEAGAGSA